jgi:hypothetical protein
MSLSIYIALAYTSEQLDANARGVNDLHQPLRLLAFLTIYIV